jgi:hypothetical protein
VTSEARAAASRNNGRKSTGPKSEEGRRRSSQNARRHGLTARVIQGSADAEQITRLAEAFLGEYPRTDASWALALDAGLAQRTLDLVRSRRLQLLDVADRDPATFQGPYHPSDDATMIKALTLAWGGADDIGSEELQKMLFRLRREAPRDLLQRQVELITRLIPDLLKLDRNENRALSQRRRALIALDRCMMNAAS